MTPHGLSQATIDAIERSLCADSLAAFAQRTWHILEPSTPMKWGWALDAICEHLEAVSNGEIKRLLMNVPPGSMKSLLTGVLFPAWEWGPRGNPWLRYIGTAHAAHLAIRDNMRCRRLIQSQWYQDRWPIELTSDQNAKTKFENSATGFRECMAFEGMTGSRGDRILIDDPHSVSSAKSTAILSSAVETFREALPSRVNNDDSAIIIIMQRLHEDDISAVAKEAGYDHLCIPMRYEEPGRAPTKIGWRDPRHIDGELMFPERFPAKQVEQLEKDMGAYAAAGQLQQRPAPRGGGMFPVDRFQIVEHRPEPKDIKKTVRSWDKAGTAGAGAYTAGPLMHALRDGTFLIEDVKRGQWSALERERHIKQTAEIDGKKIQIIIEQEPGSGGKESAEATIRMLAGWRVKADRVTGDKVSRAEPYAAQVEGGNVKILRGAWNRAFIDEHESFPNGKYKDQVDATASAFNALAGDTYNLSALAS